MSSSSSQGNSSSPTIPPSPVSSGQSVLPVEKQQTLSQLEHAATQGRMASTTGDTPTIRQALASTKLGAANMFSPLGHHAAIKTSTESAHQYQQSGAESISTNHSVKSSVKKNIFRFWKKVRSNKETVPPLLADNVPTLTSFVQRTSVTTPEANTTPAPLDPQSPTMTVQAAVIAAGTPVASLLPNAVTTGSLQLEIFSTNNARHALSTNLPKSCSRFDSTQQLVHSCSVLAKAHGPSPPASDSDDIQALPLNDNQREWVQHIDPIEQDRLRWLIDQLVQAFAEDQLKGSTLVEEIVLVGTVLDQKAFRGLIACFMSKFEQTAPLDLDLLQGIVQLVECASPGYLVDNDLVRIAAFLSKELSVTHISTSNHSSYLAWALSRVLDAMVTGRVKDLSRERDHQPMLQLLSSLKESDNTFLKYQAAYAYQALQYAPDDETPLQGLWRYTQVAAAGASGIASVFKLDPLGFLKGMEHLHQIGGGVADAIKARIEGVKAGIDGVKAPREDSGSLASAAEKRSDNVRKRSWYLALQGTALFIRQGRLCDFNLVVIQAPCRHNVNFQWGICRQLGEIAVDPLWDAPVRQQAVGFLGELYRSDAYWKPHADVKQWILTILVQISKLLEVSLKDRTLALLTDLKKDGTAEFPHHCPLSRRLPLPITSPLLAKAQEIPSVDYDLHVLRLYRTADYKQPVYIAPMAKPSLQAPDDTLFRLMENVKDFLVGEGQVMLILGDSGAGKSTFNRQLEHELWKEYKHGDRIPLFINLSSLERPEKDLVAEHLKLHNFLDDQIRELKLHHKFTLICDGYDESQLKTNLHHTNSLNQYGQWDTKLLVTCRTQYLGPDYQSRFAPVRLNQYARVANGLFQEAVIAPFTKKQIEDYVDRYIPLEPRG
ncbi:hypothetical protein BGZ96_003449 [Linnemannia gamsii]|uniref:NACHT domain-containing protein n=1 Tax=Linnemannia gamsii TaxID=64522 RepID=A0ABQ7K6W0_9FUNG|nr:hypothetical protein BGZ96_003449 [Linnemannia gamsii]